MQSGRSNDVLRHELSTIPSCAVHSRAHRESSDREVVHEATLVRGFCIGAYGSTDKRGANCAASAPPTGMPCGVSSHACAPNASAEPSFTPIVIRLRRL